MADLYTTDPERTTVTIEGEHSLGRVRIVVEAACIEDATRMLMTMGVPDILLGRRAMTDARVGSLLEEAEDGDAPGPPGAPLRWSPPRTQTGESEPDRGSATAAPAEPPPAPDLGGRPRLGPDRLPAAGTVRRQVYDEYVLAGAEGARVADVARTLGRDWNNVGAVSKQLMLAGLLERRDRGAYRVVHG